MAIEIFVSYAHEDGAKWLERVDLAALAPLRHVTENAAFHDGQLLAGGRWDETIRVKLEGARVSTHMKTAPSGLSVPISRCSHRLGTSPRLRRSTMASCWRAIAGTRPSAPNTRPPGSSSSS